MNVGSGTASNGCYTPHLSVAEKHRALDIRGPGRHRRKGERRKGEANERNRSLPGQMFQIRRLAYQQFRFTSARLSSLLPESIGRIDAAIGVCT